MKRGLSIVFVVVVTVPLCAVAWLSYSAYSRDRATTRERYAILARNQLDEIDRLVQSQIEQIEAELRERLTVTGVDERREATRRTSLIRRYFQIGADDKFLFPPAGEPVSAGERDFLDRAAARELAMILTPRTPEGGVRSLRQVGWHTWFMGDGLNFIYWRAGNEGEIIGIELERIALVSRLISALPESTLDVSSIGQNRIVLTDARGQALYQWGTYVPTVDEEPVTEIAMSQPLEAWHLRSYFDMTSGSGNGGAIAAATGVVALIIAVAFLSIYFYREHTRVVRDALERVSFVNQVSHELKTPLTNIRLYAELLESRLKDDQGRSHLGVITAESRRLSRMINNVLTFARSERSEINVVFEPVVIDDIVRRVVETFSPALAAKSIDIDLDLNAQDPVTTDPDIIEQIVSNLVSNVEKYAADGKLLAISTAMTATHASVEVSDRGPGIPDREHRRVFDAFYRVSNNLSDGVSGAGIGLTISKRLAECVHGSLRLERSNQRGATFVLSIARDQEEPKT